LAANTIIVNNNSLYVLDSNYLFDPNPGNVSYDTTFPLANVTSIEYGDLNNANDRIIALNGNVNLSATQTGIDYPGVIVDGNTFVSNVYDTSISSLYSTEFGVNPGDILIDGGAYISTFGSHAPEELIPGRTCDSLNLTVYDTNAIAFRLFQTMNGNLRYYRIASLYSSNLSANLYSTDSTISVSSASVLPAPNAKLNTPGVIFVNGEKIVYWRNYATDPKTAWTANLFLTSGNLITYSGNTYISTGNIYESTGNIANVATVLQQVSTNTLAQIRRGADGTYTPTVHLANSRVISADKTEIVPASDITYANIGANSKTYNSASNVSYALYITSNITSNVGDYITQKFTSNSAVAANLFVLGNVVNSSVVPVTFVSGNLTSLANTVSVNGVIAGGGTIKVTKLGTINANGNAVISANTILGNSTSWYSSGQSLDSSYTPASVFLTTTPGFTPAPGTTP
jgi:hypothetical protein